MSSDRTGPRQAMNIPIEQKHPRLDFAQLPPSLRRRSTDVPKPKGKREIERAKELPEWKSQTEPSASRAPSRTSVNFAPQRASGSRSRAPSQRPSTAIKSEPRDSSLSRSIKAELTDSDDDSPVDIRFNGRNAIGLKDQHRDVQSLLHLGLDYFIGFYLVKNMYPDLRTRNEFVYDALIRAARQLGLTGILDRLGDDSSYRDALGTVLTGRVSSFRGDAKNAAGHLIYGKYHVQRDCAPRVAKLLPGQAYIYPFKPDQLDPRTNAVTAFGKASTKKPYENSAIPDVLNTYFRGDNSLIERIAAMFPVNAEKIPEAPAPMVALACTAIYSVLDDYSTGEYKGTNFDGGRVQDVYEVHITLLDKLKTDKPVAYHTLMQNIFSAAGRGSVFSKGPKAPPTLMQREALAMLDLDLE